MDWKKMIRMGMNLIAEGCKQNEEWSKCQNCPFTEICDILMNETLGNTPEELFLEKAQEE